MSAIYGSNRATYIGVGELLPTFIELGLLKREKVSLYSKTPQRPVYNRIISELLVYTDIKRSESKTLLADELIHRPWHSYFSIEGKAASLEILVNVSDGMQGGGYLSARDFDHE